VCARDPYLNIYVAGNCRNQAFPEMTGVSSIAEAFAEKKKVFFTFKNMNSGKKQNPKKLQL
jgi:hypothetical protein